MPRQSKPPNLVAVMLYKLNVFILNVGVQKIKTKTRDGDRFFDIKTKKKRNISCLLIPTPFRFRVVLISPLIYYNRHWKLVSSTLLARLRVISDKYWRVGTVFVSHRAWTWCKGAGRATLTRNQLRSVSIFVGIGIGDWLSCLVYADSRVTCSAVATSDCVIRYDIFMTNTKAIKRFGDENLKFP